MAVEQEKLPSELLQRAEQAAGTIDTSRPGQITTGLIGLGVSGSLAYYLGENTQYFTNGVSISEVPLYVAFTALSLLSVRDLANVCGRRAPKTTIAGLLTGGTTGLGLGLSIAGMALGVVGDVLTCGLLSLLGLGLGWFLTRRGKKRHVCGANLPCDTWICTKCKRIIAPSRQWPTKERWNVLDVCDYLDTSGYEWNSIKSLAFLDYSSLLNAAKQYPDSPALWNPSDIKNKVSDEATRSMFEKVWGDFQKKEGLRVETAEDVGIESLFDKWQKFHKQPT